MDTKVWLCELCQIKCDLSNKEAHSESEEYKYKFIVRLLENAILSDNDCEDYNVEEEIQFIRLGDFE